MKNLYLMRHGQPVPGHPIDETRKLTTEGKRQVSESAAFLARHVGRVDMVVASPAQRSIETADAMGDALGAPVATTRLLAYNLETTPEDTWRDIERLIQESKDVLIVGHDPNLNQLLAWLIGGGDARMEWGAIAHVKTKKITNEDGSAARWPGMKGRLHWMVDVPIVERGDDQELVEAAVELFAGGTNRRRRRI